MAYKLGAFEFLLRFTPTDGGETVEVVTTPSIFALADEWADTLRAKGDHTSEWVDQKFGGAMFLLGAMEAGLMPDGPITLASIAEVMSRYEVDMQTADEVAGANPTPSAPEDAPEAV